MALCTCANHVPQLELSSISMFSFERSMMMFLVLGGSLCQIGIEISDYKGDMISVGVARPSHVLGQSVPCDG